MKKKYHQSFCKYYGNYYVNFDKFTFDITGSENIINQLEELVDIQETVNYYETESEMLLEYPNVPGYLLITEYANFSIDHLKYKNLLNYDIILSIVFRSYKCNYYNEKCIWNKT